MGRHTPYLPPMRVGGSWLRNDQYWDDYGSFIATDTIWCAASDDLSPAYPHWMHGQYKAECASCWLGHYHTEALHEKNLGPNVSSLRSLPE